MRRKLIDGVKSFAEVYQELLTGLSASPRSGATEEGGMSGEAKQVEEVTTSLAVAKKELEHAQKENEALKGAQQTLQEKMAKAEGKCAEWEAKIKEVRASTENVVEHVVTEERARVAAILELGADFPEHQAVLAACISDGTTPGDASTKVLKAEAFAKKQRVAQHDAEAPPVVPHVHSTSSLSGGAEGFDQKIEQYMKANPAASYKEAALEVSKQTQSTGLEVGV